MQATEQWGVYGISWGWESFEFDYHLLDTTGIVIFKGVFYFPNGKFPISSSISAYKDGARTKPDADFAKKVETDALTKGLSKVGFNADVFMGNYDDNKYVTQMKEEFSAEPKLPDLKPKDGQYHELAITVIPDRFNDAEELKDLIISEIQIAKTDKDRDARDVYKASTYAPHKDSKDEAVGAIYCLKKLSPEVYNAMISECGKMFGPEDK